MSDWIKEAAGRLFDDDDLRESAEDIIEDAFRRGAEAMQRAAVEAVELYGHTSLVEPTMSGAVKMVKQLNPETLKELPKMN